MALRDGSWKFELQHGGRLLSGSTDDLTLTQIDVVERASGIPWALWDPRRSVRVAMGLFVVLLVKDGTGEDEALAIVRELPGSVLAPAFDWVPPEKPLQPATSSKDQADTDPPA